MDQNGNTIKKGSNDYGCGISNVLNDYLGAGDILDTTMRNLNYDYFITNKYTTYESNALKGVAYMLDRKQWTTKFTGSADGNSQIDYVIGAPSIELLLKSYNAKYGASYNAQVYSGAGYQVSNGDDNYTHYLYLDSKNRTDRTYVISNEVRNTAAWLASPVYRSGSSSSGLFALGYAGNIGYSEYYVGNVGFRPIVHLKSGVSLKDNGDSFSIAN